MPRTRTASPVSSMPDMQKRPDSRKIPIAKVGVKDITYPVVVMDKNRSLQHTVARVNMYVDLPHQFKGTHMSRFVEILNRHRDKLRPAGTHVAEDFGRHAEHTGIRFEQ